MRGHPAFMAFQTKLHLLRSRCTLKGYALETDAAYSNEKLVAYFYGKAPDAADHLVAWKTCHSHKNMHVEGMIVGSVDAALLGQLYAMCSFVSSGTHLPSMRDNISVNMFVDVVVSFLKMQYAHHVVIQ